LMAMNLYVYEDEKATNFFPLTMTRAVFELRVGRTTMLEKLLDLAPGSRVHLLARDYLSAVLRSRHPDCQVNTIDFGDDALFVNGRWLYMGEEVDLGDEYRGVKDGETVFMRVRASTLNRFKGLPYSELLPRLEAELSPENLKVRLAEWPWDLIFANPDAIRYDFRKLGKRGVEGRVKGGLEIVGEKEDIYVAPGAVIYPNVVVDVEEGPVIIDADARVYPFSYIQGPSSIGEKTYVMPGAKIREGVTAGPVVRVGGEVEESIIHGYSNKYHDGFLGHAYVGEWVNLGALTTNSDLKNDYSEVVVYINGKPVPTGSIKVGSIIGDHTKTGIGTLLNTGTVIGVMCNVLSTDLSPKYIPSFTWYHNGHLSKGSGLRRMLNTAEVAMSRRGAKLTEEEKALYEYLYEMTRSEREYYIELMSKRAR